MGLPNILIVTTSNDQVGGQKTGLWLEEYLRPYLIFRKNGYGISVASPKGGEVPIDEKSRQSAGSLLEESEQSKAASPARAPKGNEFLYEEGMDQLKKTTRLSRVDFDEFDAVYFPGGHGTMGDLPSTPEVTKAVEHFFQNDKIVSAVCHGPAAFVGAKDRNGNPIVQGKKLTSFTNKEEEDQQMTGAVPFLLEGRLKELGADFQDAPNWTDNVVVDGKLITGQNPQSSDSIGLAIIKQLHEEAVLA